MDFGSRFTADIEEKLKKLKIEYESTNRDLSMLEKEKINQICRKETYDSLQNILNTEKMNFELLKTNNYGK